MRSQSFRTYIFDKVQKARRLIYKYAKAINSSSVDELLKTFSGVPTVVRYWLILIPFINNFYLEHIC